MVSAASVLSSSAQLTARPDDADQEDNLVSLVVNKYIIKQKEFCCELAKLVLS